MNKYQKYGLIIGLIISTLLAVYLANTPVFCLEELTCSEKLETFIGMMIFFGPCGLLIGFVVGTIISLFIKKQKSR